MPLRSTVATTLLAALLLPGWASAQAPRALPVGTTTQGTLGPDGEAAVYRFAASGAGVLTVTVNGINDLTLSVTDEDGQPLPDGTVDRDLGSQLGAELLALVLPQGGTYLVRVGSNDGGANGQFALGASWVSMPAFERPADPDGRPSRATALVLGTPRQDQLHPSQHDLWDWFTFAASEAGTVVVVTRMDEGVEGDLVLEVYTHDDFSAPALESDQDLQGNMGNESVTLEVKAGERVYIKVKSLNTAGDAVPYRLTAARMP